MLGIMEIIPTTLALVYGNTIPPLAMRGSLDPPVKLLCVLTVSDSSNIIRAWLRMGNRHKPGRSLNTRKGNSLIEFSLLMPWYFFLFVGVYDFGFYAYSLIALED